MMIKCLIPLVLFLTACTNNTASGPKVEKLEALDLVGSPINASVDTVGIKTYVLTIKNMGDTESSNLTALLSGGQDSSFQLLTSSCPNLEPNGINACTLRLRFDPKGKANDVYSTNLEVGQLIIPITVNLNIPLPAEDPLGELQVRMNNNLVASGSLINLGKVSNSSVNRVLSIKSTKKRTSSISLDGGTNFSLSQTTCSPESINTKEGCQVRVIFSGQNKASQIYSHNLVVDNLNFDLQSERVATNLDTSPGSAVLKWYNELDQEISMYDFSNVIVPERKEVKIKIKNSGTKASAGSISLSVANVYYVTSNTCKIVPAGGECSLSLKVSSTKRASGQYSSQLSFDDISLPLTASLLGNDCELSEHIDPTTYQCVPNIDNEPVANGYRTRSWVINPVPGHWGDWAYICDNHYEEDNQVCVGKMYQVNFSKGLGGSVSDGENLFCDENCSSQTVSYQYPKSLVLTASPLISYSLGSFGGDLSCAGSTCSLVLDGNKTISYNFEIKRFNLTVVSSVGGSITGSGTYDYGTNVNLSATPDVGYEFLGYSGDCSGLSCSLNMVEDKSVNSSFGVIPNQIVVTSPNHLLKDSCQSVSVAVKDINNQNLNRNHPTQIAISGISSYSNAGCTIPLTTTSLVNQGVINFYVKGSVTGMSSINIGISEFSLTASKSLEIYNSISLSVAVPAVVVNANKTINLAGGVSPFSWTIDSGLGDVSNGVYTAPATSGTVVIRVTDSLSNQSTISLSVVDVLQATPNNFEMLVNKARNLTVSGGFGPFVYSIQSGVGSVTSGVYSSLATPGLTQIKIKDALDQEVILSGEVKQTTMATFTFSPDRKKIIVTGTNFHLVQTVILLNPYRQVDQLIIIPETRTSSLLELTPSKNVDIKGGLNYTLRLE